MANIKHYIIIGVPEPKLIKSLSVLEENITEKPATVTE